LVTEKQKNNTLQCQSTELDESDIIERIKVKQKEWKNSSHNFD